MFLTQIAGFAFAVEPLDPRLGAFCALYPAEGDARPDCTLTMTAEDIAYERQQAEKTAESEGHPCPAFSDLYLEFIALSRKIANYVSYHGCALFHGALIEKEGKGYLFAARSGTGKTTHIMNWLKVYSDVTVVNGDKPILRAAPDGVWAYGTPWCGKENLSTNTAVRLEHLILLERDTCNRIEPVRYTDCINSLFTQIHIPPDPEGMKRAFEMISALSQHVRLWRLGCNMDPESARTAYEGMK